MAAAAALDSAASCFVRLAFVRKILSDSGTDFLFLSAEIGIGLGFAGAFVCVLILALGGIVFLLVVDDEKAE